MNYFFYILAVNCGDIALNGTEASIGVSYPRTYPNTVNLVCASGYDVMDGSSNVTCQADKTWTQLPYCHSKLKY